MSDELGEAFARGYAKGRREALEEALDIVVRDALTGDWLLDFEFIDHVKNKISALAAKG